METVAVISCWLWVHVEAVVTAAIAYKFARRENKEKWANMTTTLGDGAFRSMVRKLTAYCRHRWL